jgi:hypothetical protein
MFSAPSSPTGVRSKAAAMHDRGRGSRGCSRICSWAIHRAITIACWIFVARRRGTCSSSHPRTSSAASARRRRVPPRQSPYSDRRSGVAEKHVSQYDRVVVLLVMRAIDERDDAGPGKVADSAASGGLLAKLGRDSGAGIRSSGRGRGRTIDAAMSR